MGDETYLVHWGLKKGEEAKNHKYVARVKLSIPKKNRLYRYFYDKKEYESYLKSKESIKISESNSTSILKSLIDDGHSFVEKLFGKSKEKDTDYVDPKKSEKYMESLHYPDPDSLNEASLKSQEIYDDGSIYRNRLDNFKKKTVELSSEEDASLVNPYYDSYNNNEYTSNCSHCALAYDMRRRGYDVEAAPAYDYYDNHKGDSDEGETEDTVLSWFTERPTVIDNKQAVNNFNSDTKNTNEILPSDMGKVYEEQISKNDPGSRGFFFLYWRSGGAHVVVWEVQNDNTVDIIDCQNNTRYNIKDYKWDHVTESKYFRTDDKELDGTAAHNIVNKENDFKSPTRYCKNTTGIELNTNMTVPNSDEITNADCYFDSDGNVYYYAYKNGKKYISINGGYWHVE